MVGNEKNSYLERLYASLPHELKCGNHWYMFKFIEKDGKINKPPFCLDNAGREVQGASLPNKPGLDFGTIQSQFAKYSADGLSRMVDGAACEVGLDIDSGNLEPDTAQAIIGLLGGYTEKSPGLNGYHIWLTVSPETHKKLGAFNTVKGRQSGMRLEFYTDNKPLTITGDVVQAGSMAPRDDAVLEFCKTYMGKKRGGNRGPAAPLSAGECEGNGLSADEVLRLAFGSKRASLAYPDMTDGEVMRHLYEVGSLGDSSHDDWTLARAIAYWTNYDRDLTEKILRDSALVRPKWDDRRGQTTYLGLTLDKIFSERRGDGYRGRGAKCENPPAPVASPDSWRSKLVDVSSVQAREARWVLPGVIPEGAITILGGDGGSGKTSIWVNIAAALSSGGPCILDQGNPFPREGQKVVFFSGEDSVEVVLKKRLEKAGVDFSTNHNLFTFDAATIEPSDKRFDSEFVTQVVRNYRPALVIFDPLQSFLPPECDLSRRNHLRSFVGSPLIKLGKDTGTAFLIVMHSNKSSFAGRKRLADSADAWDCARSVLMVGKAGDGRRYVSHEKSNYGPLQKTVLFDIVDERIEFLGTSDLRDGDFVARDVAQARTAPKTAQALERVMEFLREQDGAERPVSELDQFLEDSGFSKKVARCAKESAKEAGILRIFSTGFGSGKKWMCASQMSEPEGPGVQVFKGEKDK